MQKKPPLYYFLLLSIFYLWSSCLDATDSFIDGEVITGGKRVPYFLPLDAPIPEDRQHLYYHEPYVSGLDIRGIRHDLHGCSFKEARRQVIDLIKTTYQNLTYIHFITGRGNHINKNGQRGVIFEAFPTWLEEESISPLILRVEEAIGAYNVYFKENGYRDPSPGPVRVLRKEFLYELAKTCPHAQFILGTLYASGHQVARDDRRAVDYFLKAANQGHAEAQNTLGMMYGLGRGVGYNLETSVRWYREAASRGHISAQTNLSTCYYRGEGVTRDIRKAVELLQAAAHKGGTFAQNLLGTLYFHGVEVQKDLKQAIDWWKPLAQAGFHPAQANLGRVYLTEEFCDPPQARYWFLKSAHQGNTEACLRLGEIYLGEMDDKSQQSFQDFKEALKWLLKAGLEGRNNYGAAAQYKLSLMYKEGKGVRQSDEIALNWLKEAADNSCLPALYELGMHYKVSGIRTTRHGCYEINTSLLGLAVKYLKAAAERGHADAQYIIGGMHSCGLGVKKDHRKAYKWWEKAAEQGHPYALSRLGRITQEMAESLEEAGVIREALEEGVERMRWVSKEAERVARELKEKAGRSREILEEKIGRLRRKLEKMERIGGVLEEKVERLEKTVKAVRGEVEETERLGEMLQEEVAGRLRGAAKGIEKAVRGEVEETERLGAVLEEEVAERLRRVVEGTEKLDMKLEGRIERLEKVVKLAERLGRPLEEKVRRLERAVEAVEEALEALERLEGALKEAGVDNEDVINVLGTEIPAGASSSSSSNEIEMEILEEDRGYEGTHNLKSSSSAGASSAQDAVRREEETNILSSISSDSDLAQRSEAPETSHISPLPKDAVLLEAAEVPVAVGRSPLPELQGEMEASSHILPGSYSLSHKLRGFIGGSYSFIKRKVLSLFGLF